MEREGADPSSVMEKQGGERKGRGTVRWRVEEKGGSNHGAHLSWGGPDMSNARSGGGGPGTVVPGRAWGRQGKREKGEREGGGWSVGRLVEWGPVAERKGGQSHCGWTKPERRVQLAGKQREKGRLPCGAHGV
jgi:hypothetical protein